MELIELEDEEIAVAKSVVLAVERGAVSLMRAFAGIEVRIGQRVKWTW